MIIAKISNILGRQLDLEEMSALICEDRGLSPATCSICGNQFVPMRWLILNPYMEGQLRHHKKLTDISSHYAGCWFVDRNKKQPALKAFCGTPRHFQKSTCDWAIPESHLVITARTLVHGEWGLDHASAQNLLQRREVTTGKIEAVHPERHQGTSGLGRRAAKAFRGF